MSQSLIFHHSLADYSGNLDILNGLDDVPGDVLEIGALTGGGTRALGGWANSHGRTMVVIDVFMPSLDRTVNTDDREMAEIYHEVLHGADNWQLFAYNTTSVERMMIYRMRSSEVVFPQNQRFCFAFIDGSHAYKDVLADARLVWPAISPGGWMAFDDYGHDLPEVEMAIDEFAAEIAPEIAEIRTFGYQKYLCKKPA